MGAAALFGLSTPLAKGLSKDVSPQLLAGLFYLGSGIGLSIVNAALSHESGTTRMSPIERWWLAGAILSGGVLAPPLQLIGIRLTPASTASLLLNLEGVLTAVLAWVVFREHMNARTVWGMVAIVAGSVVLTWSGTATWSGVWGALAIVGACLFWGLDNNLTQKVSGQDATRIAALKGLFAGTVNCALAWAAGATLPGALQVAAAMVLGFISYGLSLVLFVLALRDLGTARTGAYFSLAPFVGAGVGLLIWKEPITPQLAFATVLMGIGIWLHLTEQHGHEHTHDVLEHAHEHTHDEHHQHPHQPDDPPGDTHTHTHRHQVMTHAHPHYPDLHHRHDHD